MSSNSNHSNLHPPTHSKIRNVPIVLKSSQPSRSPHQHQNQPPHQHQNIPIQIKTATPPLSVPRSALLLSPRSQPLSPRKGSNLSPKMPNFDYRTLSPSKTSHSPQSSRLKPGDSWFTTPPAELKILNISPAAKGVILGQTQHPQSVARIQELEAPRIAPEEAPEAEKQVSEF